MNPIRSDEILRLEWALAKEYHHLLGKARPCPFCQADRIQFDVEMDTGDADDATWVVECRNCDCNGPLADGPVQAIARWNRGEQTDCVP